MGVRSRKNRGCFGAVEFINVLHRRHIASYLEGSADLTPVVVFPENNLHRESRRLVNAPAIPIKTGKCYKTPKGAAEEFGRSVFV